MTSWLAAALTLVCAVNQAPAEEGALGARVTALLLGAEEADDAQLASDARQLAQLDAVTPLLLEVVGRARTPWPDDTRLAPRQLELARQALELAGGERLVAFVRDVEREPGSPERIAAALRIVARRSSRDAILSLTSLVQAAEKSHCFEAVEGTFEESLGELLARDPARVRRLSEPFTELSAPAATVAVRVVGATGTRDAFDCLRGLIGYRAELEGPALLELGRLVHLVSPTEAFELSEEVVPFLRSRAVAEVQAAANLLGRLGSPESVPALIECLVAENAHTVRAALAALRSIGGVVLPASPELWRSWYGREEVWWQERAASLFGPPSAQDEELALAEISARLREVSEHRLHRHELVARLTPLLAHPRARVRVMACQCLARLGSRSAVVVLTPLLADPSSEVADAARAALAELEDRPLRPAS